MALNAVRQPGQVIGHAGGGLDNASWAVNAAVARIGKTGEVRTAAILDAIAQQPGGPTVLHDLRIPIPGINANIDHVVVSGRNVYLVDAKVWRPGFYWTLSGHTFRGLERFAPADKRTMPMALESITRFLGAHHVRARVLTPLLVVWPSSEKVNLHLWAMRSPSARVVDSARFTAQAHRLVGTKPADPSIVQALSVLVNSPQRRNLGAAA